MTQPTKPTNLSGEPPKRCPVGTCKPEYISNAGNTYCSVCGFWLHQGPPPSRAASRSSSPAPQPDFKKFAEEWEKINGSAQDLPYSFAQAWGNIVHAALSPTVLPRPHSMTHEDACREFGLPESEPWPDWKPYAVRLTLIEVRLKQTHFDEGERICLFGGGMRCGRCGYGIDIRPDCDTCPKCGWDGYSKLAASQPVDSPERMK